MVEYVVDLSWGGWYVDLDVLFGIELQVVFQVCGGVFWVLFFIVVWQQYGQVVELVLFVFVIGDELVDDYLGVVGEVVELGFLDYQ